MAGDANKLPQTVLKEYREAFLRCRYYGHAWFDDPGGLIQRDPEYPGTFGWTAVCSSCGTARIDWVDKAGQLEGRRYIYTEGYIVKTKERIYKEDVRSERYRRQVVLLRKAK